MWGPVQCGVLYNVESCIMWGPVGDYCSNQFISSRLIYMYMYVLHKKISQQLYGYMYISPIPRPSFLIGCSERPGKTYHVRVTCQEQMN